MEDGSLWALILAAGEGTRLSSLTTTAGGVSVPKQFCSLRGGASLMEDALARAGRVTARVLTVVASRHRRWWEGPTWSLPPDNIIVQPDNRGTAAGLLLPLLHLMHRDPGATVVILPSDHFVRDEAVLANALERASRLAREDRDHVFLLGLDPEEPDADLGYIVPAGRCAGAPAPVQHFVEKPRADTARRLIDAGALLNMFIIAASARALVSLYAARHSGLLAQMRDAVERDREHPQDAQAAHALYPLLPTLDFSRDVLQGQEPSLRVLEVPPCGWSDLGTPCRVGKTLSMIGSRPRAFAGAAGEAFLNLAEQHSRQQSDAHSHEHA